MSNRIFKVLSKLTSKSKIYGKIEANKEEARELDEAIDLLKKEKIELLKENSDLSLILKSMRDESDEI